MRLTSTSTWSFFCDFRPLGERVQPMEPGGRRGILGTSGIRPRIESVYGSVSKPCTPGEHQNSWDLWMFIPLKMVLIGIDPYPYQSTSNKSPAGSVSTSRFESSQISKSTRKI